MQRTLKRELKVLEIVREEAVGISDCSRLIRDHKVGPPCQKSFLFGDLLVWKICLVVVTLASTDQYLWASEWNGSKEVAWGSLRVFNFGQIF